MSQFAGLFKALKNEEETPTVEPSASTRKSQAKTKSLAPKEVGPTKGKSEASTPKPPAKDKNHKPAIITEQSNNTATKKAKTIVVPTVVEETGRRRGKSSNPEYTQVLSYIRKSTYKEVKRALLDSEQDFSELIENLLFKWLKNKT